MKNNVYILDTETTGLPKNYKAKVSDLDNWPRLVQFAAQTYSLDGRLLRQYTAIVKPVGYDIPKKASDIHGITHERALAEGCRLQDVLRVIHEDISDAQVIVGHNLIGYDYNIIGSELIRAGFPTIRPPRKRIDTMLELIKFCNLRGAYGPKWPKLQEAHVKMFNREFEGAHDAMHDVKATAAIFWEAVRRGIIEI
jgi:DNA polymerase III epsilon subunit-like protein